MVRTDVECSLFYVDDDRDDLQIFQEAAQAINEDVCVFEFAELMLYTLHNPPPSPSIVFVDLNMPTINGYEVIRQIKTSPVISHLPVIAYSTSDNPADIERCRLCGAAMFVTKPSTIGAIQKLLKYVIAKDWLGHEVTDSNFLYRAR